MGLANSYSSWAEIDLGAIENNIRRIGRISASAIMAVVKANGYGHGAVQVAKAAIRAGATWLGVARVEEGLELRRAGIEDKILSLGFIPDQQLDLAIHNRVALTIWEKDQIERMAAAANRIGHPANIHLKVDTGMSRLGVQPNQALELARIILENPTLVLEGIFTHLARADERDHPMTEAQEKTFLEVLDTLHSAEIYPPMVHIANSVASLTRANQRFNLVRAGIAMYGLHPSHQCPLPAGFTPALSWKTVLSQVKLLPSGRGLSYGHEYITRKNERIGTIPVGYADGFRRMSGNHVIIAGTRLPIVGRVCMDQAMVQLDRAPEAKAGDEVVIIGKAGTATITAEDVAAWWGTINYEVVTGISQRVQRIYI
jgi:alanine racemase